MNRIAGNLRVDGRLTPTYLTYPAQSIDDAAVSAAAAIAAGKLEHRYRAVHAQDSDATAADETRAIHVVRGVPASVIRFEAGMIVPCAGDATVAVDLLKGGASVLTSPIVLDSTQSARELVEATLSNSDLAADDVLELEVTTTPGTGTPGQGVFAALTLDEEAT